MAKKFDISKIQSQVSFTAQSIEENTKKVKRKEIIPIDMIDLNPDNIFNRQDTDDTIKELAEDIKKNGLYHDILVCQKDDGRYLLISGERRLKATKYNNESAISATIEEGLSDDEMLIQLFNANLQTRLISLDERLEYIQTLKNKISDKSKDNIKTMITKAFNVDERQARKLISVNDGLNDKLLSLLKSEDITINEASSYSNLPSDCQDAVYEAIIFAKEENKDINEIKNQIKSFTKQIKGKLSFTKKAISKPSINIKNSSDTINSLLNEMPNLSNIDKEKHKAKINKLEERVRIYQSEIDEIQNKTNNQISILIKDFIYNIKNGVNNNIKDESKEVKKAIKALNTNYSILSKMYPNEDFSELLIAINKIKSKIL